MTTVLKVGSGETDGMTQEERDEVRVWIEHSYLPFLLAAGLCPAGQDVSIDKGC